MDENAVYNEMLDKLKLILDDFDNVSNREHPEAEIRGEGKKIKEDSNGSTTIYQKLIDRLKIFYSEYEKELR